MGHYFPSFSLRVPEELIEKIKHIASNHKRSATKEMEYVLECYVDDWEKEHGKIDVDPLA